MSKPAGLDKLAPNFTPKLFVCILVRIVSKLDTEPIEKDENGMSAKKTGSTLYTNYKAVDGIPMAHNIEIAIAGLNENDPVKIFFNKIEISQPFTT